MAYSPDGKYLACYDGQGLVLLDAKTMKDVAFRQRTIAVWNLAYSGDGKRLATVDRYNRTASVYDPADLKTKPVVCKGHAQEVSSVALSSDGQRLATASVDQTVRLWDAKTGKELVTLNWELCYLQSVAFSTDGRRLVAAGGGDLFPASSFAVVIWELGGGEKQRPRCGLALAPSGNLAGRAG